MDECIIEGCSRSKKTRRGWCLKHYKRWARYRDPLHVEKIRGDSETRFWSKVDKRGPGECWLWTGYVWLDYGHMGWGTSCKMMGAHRISYTLAHGPIPPGKVIRHKCDIKLCVNPNHLISGTIADNIRDRVVPPTCHPDRPYHSLGLCRLCYQRQKRDEWRGNVSHRRGRYEVKTKCHPDRPHYAKDLCYKCYWSQYKKAWRKRRKEKVA